VSRTSFWPRLVGLPYERALLWHKCASTFTLIVTGIHGGLMAADYDFNESFSAESNCFGYGNIFGTLIFGAGGLLFLLSQGPVRRVSYRTFSMVHKVLVPAVIVLACLHVMLCQVRDRLAAAKRQHTRQHVGRRESFATFVFGLYHSVVFSVALRAW